RHHRQLLQRQLQHHRQLFLLVERASVGGKMLESTVLARLSQVEFSVEKREDVAHVLTDCIESEVSREVQRALAAARAPVADAPVGAPDEGYGEAQGASASAEAPVAGEPASAPGEVPREAQLASLPADAPVASEPVAAPERRRAEQPAGRERSEKGSEKRDP